MKKLISVLLCIAMLLSCTAFSVTSFAAEGTTYYVDSVDGDDSNSGKSESQAWRTLAKASAQVYEAGDVLRFKAGGIYSGIFTAQGNGTAENPITVSSYGDIDAEGKPLIYNRGEHTITFYIHNVNGWTVENLEFTAPDAKGLIIQADNDFGVMGDIKVENCTFHNIWYHETESYGSDHAAISVFSTTGLHTRIENITFSKLNIYDCAYGINMRGKAIEWSRDIYISPEESYNQNMLIEGVSLYNIFYDALIISSVNKLIVRDCSLIKTSLNTDHYTAPMWSHHAKNYLIENCEIAGAENYLDGMAVDFDGWTTDSTVQYVYSHDNVCFIKNCVYDHQTRNANCTVRYCLSVNDNKHDNTFASLLRASAYDYSICDDKPQYIDNFKFYNNTIVNGASFRMQNVKNSYIANNIFYGKDLTQQFIGKRVSTDKDTGKKYLAKFTGEFTNNCFYNYAIPSFAENSVNVIPEFVGTDFDDKNSFMLSENSKLIGAGIQVEEDMGEHDFYGNPLTETHNIGCYDGDGEKTENRIDFFSRLGNFFKKIAGYIIHIFYDLIRSF